MHLSFGRRDINGRNWKNGLHATDFYPEEKIKAVTELYDKIGIGRICEEKINAYYAGRTFCCWKV